MNRTELRLAIHPLSFMDSRANLADALLQRSPGRLLVWDAEAVSDIFRADRGLLHPGSRSLRPLLGPASVLWADGERHTAYRRLLGAPLQGRRLKQHHATIGSIVHAAVDRLKPGVELDLTDWTRRIALDVITRIVLGRSGTPVAGEFTAWLDRAFGSRSRALVYRYLRGGLPGSGEQLDAALVAAAKAGAQTSGDSLAALLLAADGPVGGIDDNELRDQIVSLLFAGHETTAAATAWTLHWLACHDTIRRDVMSEVDADSSEGTDSARIPLLHAVIQESLRITPPTVTAGPRLLPRETAVRGRTFPSGTVLTPAIYLAHHRAEYFPNPHRFEPGRFLHSGRAPEAFFPFGGGPRYCLGAQLAQLEVRMIVSALLRRWDFRGLNPRAGLPRLRGQVIVPSHRRRIRITASRG